MDKLYGVPEIMERYGCTQRAARNIMNKIGPLDIRPMKVRESAIEAWEARGKGKPAEEQQRQRGRKKKNVLPFPAIQQGPLKPGQHISRIRPKAMGE